MPEELKFRKFTKPAELDKAINTLRGICEGVELDKIVTNDELNEIVNWCTLHRYLIDRHPFSEIISTIDRYISDNELTREEMLDIAWMCESASKESEYYNFVTATIQQLEGLLHGLLADNILSDIEIKLLSEWIDNHEFLKGTYPFDEVYSLLTSVLSDDYISDDERNMLIAFFSDFIDITQSYNMNQIEIQSIKEKYHISGICAACPEIIIETKLFVFTGISAKHTRNEIAEIIINNGGVFSDSISAKTDYLVIGSDSNPCWAFSCYGRKVEKAIELRKKGSHVTIINENDFWNKVS